MEGVEKQLILSYKAVWALRVWEGGCICARMYVCVHVYSGGGNGKGSIRS